MTELNVLLRSIGIKATSEVLPIFRGGVNGQLLW